MGCGSGLADPGVSVPTVTSEDLAETCRYNLVEQDPLGVQKGVLVIFERSDTAQLMEDDTVRSMAGALHFAILWARECDARSTGDLQADAAKGPARTLRVALELLAVKTGHPELTTVPLVLFGYSAGAVLSATMEAVWPDRLAGVVMYAAGSEYLDLDRVAVTGGMAAIPMLVLANAEDQKSGTARSYRFFERGRLVGANWAFGVQNNTDHCCSLSVRPILLPWIQAIAQPTSGAAATPVNFACAPDGTRDAQGEMDCDFTGAGLGAGVTAEQTGWLPDATSTAAWLSWVTNSKTN